MNEIVNLLTKDENELTNYKRPDVLMVLKRKMSTQKDWIIASFKEYQFTEEESQKTKQAICFGRNERSSERFSDSCKC